MAADLIDAVLPTRYDAWAVQLQGMDAAAFWIMAGVLAVLATLALRYGLAAFWRLRLILDTPTARIRSAPQGYVELQGLAQPRADRLQAPLSGRPCVWYRYRVEERRGHGRNARWVMVEEGDGGQPFLLDDGTGRCLVDPTAAELHLRHRAAWLATERRPPKAQPATGHGAPSTTGLVSWIRQLGPLDLRFEFASPPPGQGASGLRSRGWQFGNSGRYRLTESRIGDQEWVYLLGRFETPRRDHREREELTRRLLAQWKRDPQRMRAFDRNGDGQIDLADWERARAQAARIAEAAEAKRATAPVLARVGPTGDRRQPFVVSTLSEADLAGAQRWIAAGGTLAGSALAVLVALMVLLRSGG